MWYGGREKLEGGGEGGREGGGIMKGGQVQTRNRQGLFVCWLVGCLTSQQHASVSQGRICSDNFTRCHTEIEDADQTFYLTQSQYTVTGPTSPSADPITPDAWQGSHWSANFEVTGMTRAGKKNSNPGSSALEVDALTTRPTRRLNRQGNRYRHWDIDYDLDWLTGLLLSFCCFVLFCLLAF